MLDEAESDYARLKQLYPTAAVADYGLAEIALRRGNTNEAIKYLELFLSNTPSWSPDAQSVRERLKGLKGASQ
jgi:tetratricopeptide (TPR) repeat protein